MNIKMILVGPMPTNCYIVYKDDSKSCIIIDPGYDAYKIKKFIDDNNLEPKAIVLTHGHYDHISAINNVRELYSIPVYSDKNEVELIKDPKLNLSINTDMSVCEHVDIIMDDYQEVIIDDIKFINISTPGHTAGGCCLYFEEDKFLISGDTLFNGTIGRTDLPTGSYDELVSSVNKKLMILPEDVIVYPGHGYRTKIGYEKSSNPYVIKED